MVHQVGGQRGESTTNSLAVRLVCEQQPSEGSGPTQTTFSLLPLMSELIKPIKRTSNAILRFFNSVKLAVTLLVLAGATVLLGAWCPQEPAVGQEKIIEQFGETTATTLTHWGVTDIFHSAYFLLLIAFLSVNLTVASFQRVFPRLKLLKQPIPFLSGQEISKLPQMCSFAVNQSSEKVMDSLKTILARQGYVTRRREGELTGEFGKFARLAASVTHVGLLTLLLGVTVTSWTGFSGVKPVRVGSVLQFADSEHSKLWMGKLPDWRVKVEASRREDYPNGQAKQWYSTLTVISPEGKKIKSEEISVNNPLSYEGVDIYQSGWAWIKFSFPSTAAHVRSIYARWVRDMLHFCL